MFAKMYCDFKKDLLAHGLQKHLQCFMPHSIEIVQQKKKDPCGGKICKHRPQQIFSPQWKDGRKYREKTYEFNPEFGQLKEI